jgi:hypothetical protein
MFLTGSVETPAVAPLAHDRPLHVENSLPEPNMQASGSERIDATLGELEADGEVRTLGQSAEEERPSEADMGNRNTDGVNGA